jgi:hypothetical protein
MASATERAVRRLEAALQSLELAVERRATQTANADDLAAEVQMLTSDRARLAENLDQAQARATRLESVNREASKRLGAVVDTIQNVLASETGD